MVSQEQIEYLTAKLREHKEEIVKHYKDGDKFAYDVVKTYHFWKPCPNDAMAFLLCDQALTIFLQWWCYEK